MKRRISFAIGIAIAGALIRPAIGATEPFRHERRAALATDAWGGMRVDWTAVADWPTGDSPVAKSVRTWIRDRLRRIMRVRAY